jgi:alpha-galactosidase
MAAFFKFAALAMSVSSTHAGNNGQALTPPMSWRSWNNYDWNINSTIFTAIADALVDTSRAIVGRPTGTSLRDIGYATVGMDEGWASCGPFPTGQWVYHRSNADGSISPVVNESLFPSMAGLVGDIHARGLGAGWYLNDCLSYCFKLGDTCGDECNVGDVAAFNEFRFDSLKLDGCSGQV